MLCFYKMDIIVTVIMVTISGSSRVKRLMKGENEASEDEIRTACGNSDALHTPHLTEYHLSFFVVIVEVRVCKVGGSK